MIERLEVKYDVKVGTQFGTQKFARLPVYAGHAVDALPLLLSEIIDHCK